MKIIALLLAIATVLAFSIAAFLAMASPAGAAECFPTLKEARAAYPTQHIAWEGSRSHREYFKGHRGEHVRCDAPRKEREVMRHDSSRRLTQKPRPAHSLAGAVKTLVASIDYRWIQTDNFAWRFDAAIHPHPWLAAMEPMALRGM